MNNMENTKINKAKFLSLYFGQDNFITEGERMPNIYMHEIAKNNSEGYLELNSLSNISDEDAAEIAKISGESDFKKVEVREVSGFNIQLQIYHENGWSRMWFLITPYVCDYLRAKGYALPYMGLSVEEQINRGWIKLKN